MSVEQETFTGPYATASTAYYRAMGLEVPRFVRMSTLRQYIVDTAERWRSSHAPVAAKLDAAVAALDAATARQNLDVEVKP